LNIKEIKIKMERKKDGKKGVGRRKEGGDKGRGNPCKSWRGFEVGGDVVVGLMVAPVNDSFSFYFLSCFLAG
jgi:hypothetical protein